MEYNTQRPGLRLPEYGRNIQKMIEYAITVESLDERNKLVQAIIAVMGQLNPHLRDVSDFNHKLWDHLFIISDFKLDVDSPYPKPSPESLKEMPEKLNYPTNDIKYLHYGKIVEKMIEKAVAMEDGEGKNAFILAIANMMKRFYINWNRDSVNDEIILNHLAILSNKKLNTENLQLSAVNDLVHRNKNNNGGMQKKKMKKKNKPKKF
jgi:signal recognition particle subunit SEC65